MQPGDSGQPGAGPRWWGGMAAERDVELPDGRTLHVYDTHPGDDARTMVVWHHGTNNIGPPPTPLAADADRLGMRFIGFDRPGYGGSTARPGRDVAAVADDVNRVLDTLGVGEVAVMGHSGGGPYALACAAALTGRVTRAIVVSSPAPFGAAGLDWFDGMAPAGVAQNRAAVQGVLPDDP